MELRRSQTFPIRLIWSHRQDEYRQEPSGMTRKERGREIFSLNSDPSLRNDSLLHGRLVHAYFNCNFAVDSNTSNANSLIIFNVTNDRIASIQKPKNDWRRIDWFLSVREPECWTSHLHDAYAIANWSSMSTIFCFFGINIAYIKLIVREQVFVGLSCNSFGQWIDRCRWQRQCTTHFKWQKKNDFQCLVEFWHC